MNGKTDQWPLSDLQMQIKAERDELSRLRAENAEMREYIMHDLGVMAIFGGRCRACNQRLKSALEGHTPTCRLAAVLKESSDG